MQERAKKFSLSLFRRIFIVGGKYKVGFKSRRLFVIDFTINYIPTTLNILRFTVMQLKLKAIEIELLPCHRVSFRLRAEFKVRLICRRPSSKVRNDKDSLIPPQLNCFSMHAVFRLDLACRFLFTHRSWSCIYIGR